MKHPSSIKAGYIPLVFCNLTKAACRLQHIIAKVDKKTGAVIEDEPESIKQGDAALVEFVPERPISIEAFSNYPSLGRLVIQDCHITVAVGVVKEVVKMQYQPPIKIQ